MSLIIAKNISKSFGAEDVLSDISLTVPPNARIGMVGPNGSGKSTLLEILIGLQAPDQGSVQRAKNFRIGYLPQQLTVIEERSAQELCFDVFSDLIETRGRLKKLEASLSVNPDDSETLGQYGKMLTAFESAGGFMIETRVRQTLEGLGISDGEESRPWGQLSGGQKTRAYLAKLLLSEPDLLVLDEPTNHLDIDSVEFLENYLQSYSGAVLLVSHDRFFLDQVASSMIDLSWSIEFYSGNYTSYLRQRCERYERRLKEYEAQQAHIAKEEEFIRRNIEGVKTRQAQGRRKRLERLIGENALTRPPSTDQIKLQLRTDLRSGDLVLRTRNVKVGYADDRVVLISMPDATLLRGECAAIIGPNGTGKSTLIKTILGQLEPLEGEILMGSNLKIGYFAQAHELLRPDFTVFDEIAESAPAFTPAEIRNFAARFLFNGDDVYKKISSLSGGERGRLAIALLSLKDANLLLLDEPMNHLDVASQETLQAILKEFNGTILLISHDRYLVDAMATQLWIVDPSSRSLEIYAGSYREYIEKKKAAKRTAEPDGTVAAAPKGSNAALPDRKPKRSNNERLRLEKKARALEERITALEEELSGIGAEMNEANLPFERLSALSERYNKVDNDLSAAIDEWSALDL